MIIRGIVWVILISGSIGPSNAGEYCIDATEAAVAGLLPGMNAQSIQRLGSYISLETTTGEDDGGGYEEKIYHYSEYDISIVRNYIDSIRITSPKFMWGQKITIGTDRILVRNHVKTVPVKNTDTESQYKICSDVGDIYMILRYTNNKVSNIEMMIDRP